MMGDRLGRSWIVLAVCLACAGCDAIQARSLAKEGNALYRAGKHQQALTRFQQAARLDPTFPTIQLHLGYTNMALLSAHPDTPSSRTYAAGAISGFRNYMKLEPTDERGPRYYLQILLDSGRHGEALEFLLRQHQRHPKDVKIVASLGAVSSKAGRFSEALKWYEKRAQLLPREAKAQYLIGTLCWQHLYKNSSVSDSQRVKLADRGIAALQQALKLRPDYGEAMTYVNLLYRERSKGQPEEAAREADMATARTYHKKALLMIKARAAEKENTKHGTRNTKPGTGN